MRRYLIFKGDDYYPKGGMDDFVIDYETIGECKIYINFMYKKWTKEVSDLWVQIYDTEDMKEVMIEL